jgi:hypothetical protein
VEGERRWWVAAEADSIEHCLFVRAMKRWARGQTLGTLVVIVSSITPKDIYQGDIPFEPFFFKKARKPLIPDCLSTKPNAYG